VHLHFGPFGQHKSSSSIGELLQLQDNLPKVDCLGKFHEFFVDNIFIVLGSEGNLILIRLGTGDFLNSKVYPNAMLQF